MKQQNWNIQLREWILKSLYSTKFEKDARVKIRKTSEFAKQNSGIGVMETDFGKGGNIDGEPAVNVKFENGYSNSYRRKDLELADYLPGGKLEKKNISVAANILKIPEESLEYYLSNNVQELSQIYPKHKESIYFVTGLSVFRPQFTSNNFEGEIIVKNNKKYEVNFLCGEFGEEVFDHFMKIVNLEYKDIEILSHLNLDKDTVTGSSPFSTTLVNEIIRDSGLRTATPADLELMIEQGSIKPDKSYVDTALALKTQCEDNQRLAKDMARQIKKRDGKLECPVLIPLAGLNLTKFSSKTDLNLEYSGLAFKLRDEAQVIYAPELLFENNMKSFDKTNDYGLPIFKKDGSRTVHIRQFGLLRVFTQNWELHSEFKPLDVSNNTGRIVIVKEMENI